MQYGKAHVRPRPQTDWPPGWIYRCPLFRKKRFSCRLLYSYGARSLSGGLHEQPDKKRPAQKTGKNAHGQFPLVQTGCGPRYHMPLKNAPPNSSVAGSRRPVVRPPPAVGRYGGTSAPQNPTGPHTDTMIPTMRDTARKKNGFDPAPRPRPRPAASSSPMVSRFSFPHQDGQQHGPGRYKPGPTPKNRIKPHHLQAAHEPAQNTKRVVEVRCHIVSKESGLKRKNSPPRRPAAWRRWKNPV